MPTSLNATGPRKRILDIFFTGCLLSGWIGSGGPANGKELTNQSSLPPDCTLCVDPLERPIGWAAAEGGTTGGEPKAKTVLARTHAELARYAADPKVGIIYVCGVIGGPEETDEIKIGSNKTVIGVGREPTVRVMLDINGVQNVIVRNLFLRPIYVKRPQQKNPDALEIHRSQHVWIDHCDIQDGFDGNLDITDRADFVTVSWCKFSYTEDMPQADHRFAVLIGSGTHEADRGKLNVTLHHNWWADNVNARMPRARYGQVHIFNNYFTSRGNDYCIRSDEDARVFVEANYFEGVNNPIDNSAEFTGHVRFSESNRLKNVKGNAASRGKSFEPNYPYAYLQALDQADDVPSKVRAGAGPLIVGSRPEDDR